MVIITMVLNNKKKWGKITILEDADKKVVLTQKIFSCTEGLLNQF